MLTSLIIQLRNDVEKQLPASLGRAGQALLLRIIAAHDESLAEQLHEGSDARPYTVSNLVMGKRKAGSLYLRPDDEGWLRFTGLSEPVSEALLAWAKTSPQEVELDGHCFRVSHVTFNPAEHAWAGVMSYPDLAAPFLLSGAERFSRQIKLAFVTPTTFRSRGRFVPLPLPELVFGSLLNRWQAFAPIALHPEVRRFAEEMVALSHYQIRSRGMPYKQGQQIGFVGQATFTALQADRYWLAVLHLLAAYAFFSGVGYQTTTGLGQARVDG